MQKNIKSKIYLAGPCDSENRTVMVNIAKLIRQLGYVVYCPFELKIDNAWEMTQEEWAKAVFDKDMAALKNCDIFLMISLGRESTAGTNFEQGYAYSLNKPTLVFQITEKPTSIMTYCGCHSFINCTLDNVDNRISYALTNNIYYTDSCKTVLT